MNSILKDVVNNIINMNDPSYINALVQISKICSEKADVLTNMQDIQQRFDAAQSSMNKCNDRLKELIEE